MEENRIPKALFYGELVGDQRSRGGKHKRYKDVLKFNLKVWDIPIETWERQALNRPEWRAACRVGVERFERRRIDQLQETCIAHAAQNQPVPNADYVYPDWCFWPATAESMPPLRLMLNDGTTAHTILSLITMSALKGCEYLASCYNQYKKEVGRSVQKS